MKKEITKRNKINLQERILIEINYCVHYKGIRYIARLLNRNASSISREIGDKERKGNNKYDAYLANRRSMDRRQSRKKKEKLKNSKIRLYVVGKLKTKWSPEQISIRIYKDIGENISHEAIYQYVYSTYKQEDLRPYLTLRRKKRMIKNYRTIRRMYREILPSIENRPQEVEERIVVGHLEDDCVLSLQSKDRLKTINERVSGVVFIEKMQDGTMEESTKAVLRALQYIPREYLKTLTRDRGSENRGYQRIENELGLKVYFAHPYSSWERGSNENSNGLIRRYFPKKTDFSKITYEEIKKVEFLLNTRPRKRLGGLTPYEVYYKLTGVAIGS